MLKINEIFYSIQGEGYHAGRAAIFIRLAGCNLTCNFCDTEFMSGEEKTEDEILRIVRKLSPTCRFIVLTGGEPSMSPIGPLVRLLQETSYYVAMETNGMFEAPEEINWITLSPKTDWGAIKQRDYDEIKIVLEENKYLPKIQANPEDKSKHYAYPRRHDDIHWLWASPMNFGARNRDGTDAKTTPGAMACTDLDSGAIAWTMEQVLNYPNWRLNMQLQKIIGVR